MKEISVPISPGELIDKITILRIKSRRMTDERKLVNVRHELQLLEGVWRDSGAAGRVDAEETALETVNGRLWDIEDEIREKEMKQAFDAGFIELARAVYITNDERAATKRAINEKLGSKIVEEKSYKEYR